MKTVENRIISEKESKEVCSSLKVGYSAEKKAREALARIKKISERSFDFKTGKNRKFRSKGQKTKDKIPSRKYFCDECHEWHLTSKKTNKTMHS